MELRGWSAQQAFDYLMGTHWDRPWRIVDRMARAMTRKRILFDPALGDLHITRNFVGTLQAYRKKASRSCSSSFTHAPASWSSKFEHVKAGDVHDAEGNFLFTLR
ncbi:hypothetical protein [Roseobacter phage RDJL6]|nr:hypothetical protein [Roseobacter phage RDJL6]